MHRVIPPTLFHYGVYRGIPPTLYHYGVYRVILPTLYHYGVYRVIPPTLYQYGVFFCDVWQCAFPWLNNCSQICTNTKDSFVCSCFPEFTPNGKDCIANDVPALLLANGDEIRRLKLTRAGTGAYDGVIGGESRINAIDYDVKNGTDFFLPGICPILSIQILYFHVKDEHETKLHWGRKSFFSQTIEEIQTLT